MKHLRIFILLLATIGSIPLYAQLQGQARVDSLLGELPKQKEDTNKVKLLNSLSFGFSSINPDNGIAYGLQSIALATKLRWKKGVAWANNNLSVNFRIKGDYSKSLEYARNALAIASEIADAFFSLSENERGK